jgi:transmembrane sensor
VSRQAFHHLLKKYLEGNCSAEERKLVEQWYGLLDKEDLPSVTDTELSAIDDKLWNVVQAKMNEKESVLVENTPVRRLWPRLAVAASIAGLLLVLGYALSWKKSSPDFFATHASSNLIQKVNHTEKEMDFVLEDNSTVTLQAHASLTYPKHFESNKREVYLQGEAFFQVQKNTSKPFYVHSNHLLVQVVGTSFMVWANPKSKRSEVDVMTGKVMVSKNETSQPFLQELLSNNPEKVTLTPNQRVIYERETQQMTVSLVEKPVPIPSVAREMTFVFNETPLLVVMAGIEKTYGVQIITAGQDFSRCTFTGDVANQTMYDQLEFICQSVGATYRVKGTTIVIEGGKCQ